MKKIRLNKEFVESVLRSTGADDSYLGYWRKVFREIDYQIIADEKRPQLIFVARSHGNFNIFKRYAHHACVKVFLTEEMAYPDPNMWDYSFSLKRPDNTNFHIICAAYHNHGFKELLRGDLSPRTVERRRTSKLRFCNFVYCTSYFERSKRGFLYKALSEYKRVDAPGVLYNNMRAIPYVSADGSLQERIEPLESRCASDYAQNKLDFISHYKFTIAAENLSKPGYITEKLLHPLLVGSIPIYWGASDVADYFNPERFINCHDFKDIHAVVEHVKKVDSDEALYRSYLEGPAILPDSLCHRMGIESVRKHVEKLLDVATQSPPPPPPPPRVSVSRKPINYFVRLPRRLLWLAGRRRFDQLRHRLPQFLREKGLVKKPPYGLRP